MSNVLSNILFSIEFRSYSNNILLNYIMLNYQILGVMLLVCKNYVKMINKIICNHFNFITPRTCAIRSSFLFHICIYSGENLRALYSISPPRKNKEKEKKCLWLNFIFLVSSKLGHFTLPRHLETILFIVWCKCAFSLYSEHFGGGVRNGKM